MLRPYRGGMPVVHPTAFVDESAQVIGDVQIGAESSVWMNAVIRADVNSIRIGERTNVQDGTVIHVMHHTQPTAVGDDVTIGHGAIVHGCTVGSRVLIGMGAILLNGSKIGKNSLVGAGALVTEGKEFPPNSLIVGAPARAIKTLDEKAAKSVSFAADWYVKRWNQYAKGLKRIG